MTLQNTVLVTGGAGFIGSNFVLDWLAASGEPVVNLDALTYAGNRENLASLDGDPRHVFVQGDIRDRPLLDRLLAEHRPRAVRPLRRREPRRPQHPRPGGLREDQRRGHLHAARGGARALGGARRRAKAAFRFLHVSTDEVYGSLAPDAPAFTETHPLRAEQPLLGEQGGERPPGARLAPHLRPAGAHHQLLATTTGPIHFPEKLIPLMIVNALAGKPLPVYGDGMQVRDWLYVERPLQRDPRGARRAAASARPTTSAAGTRSPTSRSSHTVCALLDEMRPDPAGPLRAPRSRT